MAPEQLTGDRRSRLTVSTGWMQALGVIALVACSHDAASRRGESKGISGTPDDVHTRDGAYDGYRLSRKCRERDCVGVKGTGARWASSTARDRIGKEARFPEDYERFRADALGALGQMRSIHSHDLGDGCTDLGLVIWMRDWHEVDRAIAITGDFLQKNDLREEVTLCIDAADELLNEQ